MTGDAGILGGSFDPPHIGHVMMARTAADKLGLDKVYLMPALRPPHKDPDGLSAWEDRLEMTRLAARDLETAIQGLIDAEVAVVHDDTDARIAVGA